MLVLIPGFLLHSGDIGRFNEGSTQRPSNCPTVHHRLKLSFSLMCTSHLRTVGEMNSTWTESTVQLEISPQLSLNVSPVNSPKGNSTRRTGSTVSSVIAEGDPTLRCHSFIHFVPSVGFKLGKNSFQRCIMFPSFHAYFLLGLPVCL